jgi:glutathione S-transferase
MRALIDDLVTLTDSSVICQYLEDRYWIVFRWTAMR